jgi:Small Multidrug Resistance protein
MLCGLRLDSVLPVRNDGVGGSLRLGKGVILGLVLSRRCDCNGGRRNLGAGAVARLHQACADHHRARQLCRRLLPAVATLHTIPVAVAYAVWSGAGVALITLIAWAMFGQRLDAFALLGIALIVAGVLVIRILSDASAH